MQPQDDLAEVLPRYLRVQHKLSDDAIQSLWSEWSQQGDLVEFLVGKGLLARATARTLAAVRKGYFEQPFAAVLGLTIRPVPPPEPTEPGSGSPRAPVERAAAAIDPTLPGPGPSAATRTGPPTRPTTGMKVGRFTLQESLGEGITGAVYRSFHVMLSIPVAIKVFEPIDLSVGSEARKRFLREAQTLARLHHPNIVRVHEADVHEQFPYIVMEYVGERTLATQIQNLNRLPAPRVAQIGIAVADALDFTWQKGLLHRDVKPANILERRDGRIKLVDFGISAERTSDGGLDDPQAVLGFVSGTPSFIAPEQALTPNDIDFRADMYGLGATLYNAAVGRPPFIAATAYETIMAQIYEDPIPITQLEPGFDGHLAATIHRMLRRDRQDRFSSWAEAREALGRLQRVA